MGSSLLCDFGREWQSHGSVWMEFSRGSSDRAVERAAVGPDGYFFLPVEGEEGLLRVSGPAVWSFSPLELSCRPSASVEALDAVFRFLGVSVSGVARCAGCAHGAADVSVSLGDNTVASDASGNFVFAAQLPGPTTMAFARGSWRQEASVLVGWDGQLSGHESLVLPGFAVVGRGTPEAVVRLGSELVAVVDASGVWRFDAVPSGEYELSATLTRGNRVWRPESSISVKVTGSDVTVDRPVLCVRFAVSGTTLPQAAVTVNGKQNVVQSSETGKFELLVVEGETLRVTAVKQGFVFPEVVFESAMAVVPPILPSAVQLCVRLDTVSTSSFVVSVSGQSKSAAGGSNDGVLCFPVGLGEHSISVAGAVFDAVPPVKISEPLTPPSIVVVRQTRASLRGRVQLLSESGSSSLTIAMDGGSRTTVVNNRDGTFAFDDVLPGEHVLSVRGVASWCWERESLTVVTSGSAADVLFVHKGFLLRHDCSATTATLAPAVLAINGVEHALPCGSVHCVPGAPPKTAITIRPVGCMRYEPAEATVTLNSSDKEPVVQFEAAAWLLRGRVQGGRARLQLDGSPLPVKSEDGSFATEIALSAPKFRLQCEAETVSHLCSPRVMESEQVSACLNEAVFSVGEGSFVRGRVDPAVAGVAVSVTCEDGVHAAVSDAQGVWTVGPLPRDAKCGNPTGVLAMHSVEPSERDPLTLLLVPLAELRVLVSDQKTGRPVSEAVLSLSGPGGFRKNELSQADGAFVFEQLVPGEYHLRPVLKEFVFDPAQISISLERGVRRELKVAGTRVAFSAFGQVVGLNNEPEKLVTVVARHEQGGAVVAEGRSDDKGQFRVRGLAPGKRYFLSAHDDRLERTAPSEVSVQMTEQDMQGLFFVGVRRVLQAELAGAVNSEASPSSIFVQLFRDGKVERSSNRSTYFDFRDLQPGSYELLVWSDVSDRTHEHSPLRQAVELAAAQRLFVAPRLSVLPRRDANQSGPSDNSPAMGALLVIAIALAFVFREQLLARIKARASGETLTPGSSSSSTPSKKDDKKSFLEGTIAGGSARKR